MTLALGARPTLVAREKRPGIWDWQLEPDDVAVLRLALADGLVGTAQRRENGGQFVLLAWNIPMQRAAASPLKVAREERRARQALLAPEGYTPRVYRQPSRAVGGRTHFPYAHEPSHW